MMPSLHPFHLYLRTSKCSGMFLLLTLIGAIVFMQFLYTLPIFYKEKMHLTESSIGNLLAINGLLIYLIEMPLVYTLERKFKVIDNMSFWNY